MILRTLELLKEQDLSCGLSVMFSAQEETGERGAMIAGYQLKPDIAVALDVSFAHTPDADETKCGKMGNGPDDRHGAVAGPEDFTEICPLAQQNRSLIKPK